MKTSQKTHFCPWSVSLLALLLGWVTLVAPAWSSERFFVKGEPLFTLEVYREYRAGEQRISSVLLDSQWLRRGGEIEATDISCNEPGQSRDTTSAERINKGSALSFRVADPSAKGERLWCRVESEFAGLCSHSAGSLSWGVMLCESEDPDRKTPAGVQGDPHPLEGLKGAHALSGITRSHEAAPKRYTPYLLADLEAQDGPKKADFYVDIRVTWRDGILVKLVAEQETFSLFGRKVSYASGEVIQCGKVVGGTEGSQFTKMVTMDISFGDVQCQMKSPFSNACFADAYAWEQLRCETTGEGEIHRAPRSGQGTFPREFSCFDGHCSSSEGFSGAGVWKLIPSQTEDATLSEGDLRELLKILGLGDELFY